MTRRFLASLLFALAGLSAAPVARAEDPASAVREMRCRSLLQNMRFYVDRLEDAGADMTSAYLSGDMDAFDEALSEYNQALNAYNDTADLYDTGGCEEAIGEPAPDAPEWHKPTGGGE